MYMKNVVPLVLICFFSIAFPVSVQASTAGPPANISFSCGWEIPILDPGCWHVLQAAGSYSFQRVTDHVRKGSYAARIEVRPGDSPISSGERAEVSRPIDTSGSYFGLQEGDSSGTQYYAFSVMLPSDWKTTPGSDGKYFDIILQLHGPDILGQSPDFAFETRSFGKYPDRFSLDMTSGDMARTGSVHTYNDFSDGSLNLGKWTDFVMKVTYAKDATGSVDIWRRNEGATNFTNVLSLNNIPTLQYSSLVNGGAVAPHYWKHGLYRNAANASTNVLYLDGFTRGTAFNDVVAEAFPIATSVTNTPTPTPTPTPASKIGDANASGTVDEADFSIWRAYYKTTVSAGAVAGDFNADGKVDGIDYVLWLIHLGT
jgi:hypothetical protein